MNDDFPMVHPFSPRSDVQMNSCWVYRFMCLWADNIAMMNIWFGSTGVPFGLTFATVTEPRSFLNISIITLQIVPALLQIVPGLKGSKQKLVDKQANRTAK